MGPGNEEWEIYVLRYRQPKWDPQQYHESELLPFPPFMLIALIWELPRFFYHAILLPLWRFFVDLIFAVAKGRRSRTVWVEAISWGIHPHSESILWSTTPDHLNRVIDQVAAGLEEGKIARPLGGVFQGQVHR
jgi:hypothetical protein